MDQIEMARELFQKLERVKTVPAAEVARRAFRIQDRLATIRS